MNKKHILIVSNPDTMNKNLFQWISTTEAFDLTFAEAHEQAIELSNQQLFDMVLIDNTDKEINDKKLKAILPIFNSETLLLSYKGEPAHQLNAKVEYAFDQRKLKRMKRLLILDSSTNEGRNLPPFSLN